MAADLTSALSNQGPHTGQRAFDVWGVIGLTVDRRTCFIGDQSQEVPAGRWGRDGGGERQELGQARPRGRRDERSNDVTACRVSGTDKRSKCLFQNQLSICGLGEDV